jgi:hypothetical protein
VRASDGVATTNTTVSVTLLDVNDNAPAFSEAIYSFDLAEDTPIGTTVGSVYARDDDLDDNGKVTYEMVSDWGSDVFQLDSNKGTFSLRDHLDFEEVRGGVFWRQ